MLTTMWILQCLLWVRFYKMTRPQHINSYLVTCTNKRLLCSLTSMVKHLMLVNDKNHWSIIQRIWPLFDIKTSIHKGKIVSRNEKRKKTIQSVIKVKINRNNGTKEEEQSFSHSQENTTELWWHKTKFLFESIQVLLLFVEYFIHLSLKMISLIRIQWNIKLLKPTIKTIMATGFYKGDGKENNYLQEFWYC